MRRTLLILVAAAVCVAGCGSGDETTPAACLAPAGAYLAALRDAPQPVRIDGRAPISSCLTENQPGGKIADVGATLVRTATILNRSTRSDPAGGHALALGYLIGATARGAARTSGIHAELLRRLRSAALFSGGHPLPPEFRRAYARGYAAGRDNG